jgi:hypothetical protein
MHDFNVTPHVAQNTTNRCSAIDQRTTRHRGYEISQQKRKFTLTMAAYDLIKLPRLIGVPA